MATKKGRKRAAKKSGSSTPGGSFLDIARAMNAYAASEGLGTNDPMTYGDFQHVAEQLDAGRNPDGTKAKKAKSAPAPRSSATAPRAGETSLPATP